MRKALLYGWVAFEVFDWVILPVGVLIYAAL